MLITVRKVESFSVCRVYYYQQEIEIDPALLEQLETEQHPDYDSIESWLDDQDIDWDDPREIEEPYSELETTDYYADYEWEPTP